MIIPRGQQDTKAVRELLATGRGAVADRAASLSEPWKTHFTKLKRHYDEALAKLPASDQAPMPMEFERYVRCLYSMWEATEDVLRLLAEKPDARSAQDPMSVGRQFGSAVAGGQVDERFKASDLVPRDFCMELCRMAKEAGIEEGEKKVHGEIEARKQLVAKRRDLVNTSGLPMPDEKREDVLAAPEEEFRAALTKASTRKAALQERGRALQSQSPLILWLSDELWACFEEMLAERAKPAGGQPPRVMVG